MYWEVFIMKAFLSLLAAYFAYVCIRLLFSTTGRIKIFNFSIGWRN